MQKNYKAFVDRMIQRYEGGYCWDAGDAGGPTNYGITCYDLAQHRHQTMTSMHVWAPIVRAMPLSEAEDIYAAKYATACAFDALNDGCDCVVMDFGVNSGPSRAVKYAQLVVGVTHDGILGDGTLAAINAMDASKFVNDLCDLRLGFLRALGIWSRFGVGWSARVADLRRYSLHLIQEHKTAPLVAMSIGKSYA
jgi:lysozyme family protein